MFQHLYHSKLLLFGEHSLLQGSQALAVPYSAYNGKWSFENTDSSEAKTSNGSLRGLFKYLVETPVFGFEFRQKKMEMVLDKGLWFDSSIPQGYGLGSSGALCAAVYTAFGENQIKPGEQLSSYKLLQLRSILAGIENHFHGASSGLDPMISYLNQPVLVRSNQEMHLTWPNKGIPGMSIFLIDTGIQRKTGPFVEKFKALYETEYFQRVYAENYEAKVNLSIQTYMESQGNALLETLEYISEFQYHHLPSFIPDAFKPFWKQGLDTKAYSLKLCGAGGGGFILGFCKDFDLVKQELAELSITFFE